MQLLEFTPLYMERVWGGRNLESKLGRKLPEEGGPIGESWEIVDRPGEQSVVAKGPFGMMIVLLSGVFRMVLNI